MRTHYVINYWLGDMSRIIGVVHFEKSAENICEYLNRYCMGFYNYEKVINSDLCSRFR